MLLFKVICIIKNIGILFFKVICIIKNIGMLLLKVNFNYSIFLYIYFVLNIFCIIKNIIF